MKVSGKRNIVPSNYKRIQKVLVARLKEVATTDDEIAPMLRVLARHFSNDDSPAATMSTLRQCEIIILRKMPVLERIFTPESLRGFLLPFAIACAEAYLAVGSPGRAKAAMAQAAARAAAAEEGIEARGFELLPDNAALRTLGLRPPSGPEQGRELARTRAELLTKMLGSANRIRPKNVHERKSWELTKTALAKALEVGDRTLERAMEDKQISWQEFKRDYMRTHPATH